MIVTVTSIRLRKWWFFFRLSWHGLHISRQAKAQPGFIRMRNTGSGTLHFTLTGWKDEASMKSFARSGAHQASMRITKELATELRIYTFEAGDLPAWPEAKQAILEKGKVLTFT